MTGIVGMGTVALRTPDAGRLQRFYETTIGLRVLGGAGNIVDMGVADGPPLLRIESDPAARRPPGPTAGLYHFALLVPSRPDLARAFLRFMELNTRLQGASDHLVSEAIYLADPDGNGIEVYADRPRDRWPSRNGKLTMATEPLDLQGLVDSLGGAGSPWDGMPVGTRVGHIHLHVALLRDAERFYCERLGFDLVIRYGPSALFVSAGGYHHHIGLNTWAGVGVPEAPPDAVGLSYFTIDFEDDATRRAAAQGLRGAGIAVEDGDARSWVEDPSGVRIALVVRR